VSEDKLERTAVSDENGRPRLVYHGTSRDFVEFEEVSQEEAFFGPGFYFTEDRDVARGYAEIRHIPPIRAFPNDAALQDFLGENPDWEVVGIHKVGTNLVVQFRNEEHRPKLIHAHLLIERPFDLDQVAPEELLRAVREQFFVQVEGERTTNADLYREIEAAFAADGVTDEDCKRQTHEFLIGHGYDGLTSVDRRHDTHHRVWVAFSKDQIVELTREEL
jgi:hypothetical protein